MVVRLGYRDKVVYVDGGRVYLFRGRLYSAPLDEVLRSAYSGDGLVPPEIREIAGDVARIFEALPNLDDGSTTRGPSGQTIYA